MKKPKPIQYLSLPVWCTLFQHTDAFLTCNHNTFQSNEIVTKKDVMSHFIRVLNIDLSNDQSMNM